VSTVAPIIVAAAPYVAGAALVAGAVWGVKKFFEG
jgi:hypothetical protein